MAPTMFFALAFLAGAFSVVAAASVSPRWEYCSGVASATPAELYRQPPCTDANVQRPFVDTASVSYAPYRIEGLSFCCKANYTALLPVGTDIAEKDAEAFALYDRAKRRLIDRFDCTSYYPLQTCEPCLYAYRTWLCAMMFPLRCEAQGTAFGGHSALKVCKAVCLEVVRKCPAELEFSCGFDESGVYGDWTRTNPVFDGAGGVGGGGCNRMHYNTVDGVSRQSGAASLTGWSPGVVLCWLAPFVSLALLLPML